MTFSRPFLSPSAGSAVGLAVSLVVCFGAAQLGSLLTRPALPVWYAGLAKPSWTPPNWLFPPVWTTLFALMAIAAWLVWRASYLRAETIAGGFSGAAWPLGLFAAQLVLNVAWSGLFFGLRMPGPAFALIVVLICAILATLVSFRHATPLAGWLLLPYLIWVGYAATLNLAIWRMNAR